MDAPFETHGGGVITDWIVETTVPPAPSTIKVFAVESARRDQALKEIQGELEKSYFRDIEFVRMLGRDVLAEFVKNKLPKTKKTRSGDFGEILAHSFVTQVHGYVVPIRKHRTKEEQDVSMRGDDVVGIIQVAPPRLLKVEAKSRKSLAKAVLQEAFDALERNDGRPSSSTLAFIAESLREQGQDDLSKLFYSLLASPPKPDQVEHLIFCVAQAHGQSLMTDWLTTVSPKNQLSLRAVQIDDHQVFIQEAYEGLSASILATSK